VAQFAMFLKSLKEGIKKLAAFKSFSPVFDFVIADVLFQH